MCVSVACCGRRMEAREGRSKQMTTTTTGIASEILSDSAKRRLTATHDLRALDRAWARGNYGTLHASDTGEMIGLATREQALSSYEAGSEGHIDISLTPANGRERGLVSAYVQP